MPTEREPYFASGVWDTPEESGVDPGPEPNDYEPPTCDRCGTVHDDWDNWCEECGAPLTVRAEQMIEARIKGMLHDATEAEIERAGF